MDYHERNLSENKQKYKKRIKNKMHISNSINFLLDEMDEEDRKKELVEENKILMKRLKRKLKIEALIKENNELKNKL